MCQKTRTLHEAGFLMKFDAIKIPATIRPTVAGIFMVAGYA